MTRTMLTAGGLLLAAWLAAADAAEPVSFVAGKPFACTDYTGRGRSSWSGRTDA